MQKAWFLIAFFGMALPGCQRDNTGDPTGKGESKRSEKVLPSSNGARLELLIAAEDDHWKGVAGKTFRNYFTSAQYGLPQPEPEYSARQVDPESVRSTLIRRARNLIVLETGTKEEFEISRDVFARPQLYIKLAAADSLALGKLIAREQAGIRQALRQSEIKHLRKILLKRTKKLPEALREKGLSLKIPLDYDLEQNNEQVAVFWKKGTRSDQGLIIYTERLPEDYRELESTVIPLRDSLTGRYIKGEREGTHMTTETLVPPRIRPSELAGHFALETRGLWRTKGDFMGGPFINYTLFDEDQQRLIMIDGFVFAPEMNKRDLLFELETIIASLEVTP